MLHIVSMPFFEPGIDIRLQVNALRFIEKRSSKSLIRKHLKREAPPPEYREGALIISF